MSLDLVLLAHIAGSVVWMGGVAVLALIGVRLRHSPDLAAVRGYARAVSLVGIRVLTPAAVVVFVSGLWLVLAGDEWSLAQPWLLLGISALFLAVLIGAVLLRRGASQLELALRGGAPDRVAVGRGVDRLLLGYGLILAMLVLAVLDMVFKPGA